MEKDLGQRTEIELIIIVTNKLVILERNKKIHQETGIYEK